MRVLRCASLLLASVLLSSGCVCRSGDGSNSVNRQRSESDLRGVPQWLDSQSIEAALKQQEEYISKGSHAFSNHVEQLFALQKMADLVLRLTDQNHLELQNVKFTNDFPQGQFPVADLKTYFPPHKKATWSIDLAVIVMPDFFAADPHQPSPVDLIRQIDEVLRTGGARRRVFESIGNGRFYKLDSGVPSNYGNE